MFSLYLTSLSLTLPSFPTINAGHKCGHGLIRRTRLQLIVRAFGGPALGVRAGEVVGGRLHLGFVFVFVPHLFCLNQGNPFVWIHVLVRHECQLVRLDLFGGNQLSYVVIAQVDAHGAQTVGVNLHKVPVVPFFHDVFRVRFTQRVVVDAAFQIEGRIFSSVGTHSCDETGAEFGANIFPKLIRICNLQGSYGV
jgi:hypothetical protein